MKRKLKIPIKDLPLDVRETILRLGSAFQRLNKNDKKKMERRCNEALGSAILRTVSDFYKELGYTYDSSAIDGVWEVLGGNND